jgi:hypothetical protein
MKALLAASALLVMPPCERPPVEFQGPSVPAVVLFADPETVDAVCREVGGAQAATRILACTNAAAGVMLLPDPCLFDDRYARLACHERAHLDRADGSQGWRH